MQANIDGKDTVAYASNLLNLSTLYYTLHQADSANRCINTLIDIADSLNDLDLQVKIYNNIANRKIFEKNYAEAEKYLIHAIRLSSPHFPTSCRWDWPIYMHILDRKRKQTVSLLTYCLARTC